MEMQELEIILAPDGTVHVAVKGVTGQECLKVTEGLEQTLGTVTDRTFTAAAFEGAVLQGEKVNILNRKE